MSKFNIRKLTYSWEDTTLELHVDASPAQPTAGEPRQEKLAVILVILLLCLFEIHTLQLIQVTGFFREVAGAQGILHGEAEYRAFQNRLLGPLLVELCCKASGQAFAPTYALISSLLVAASNFLCYYLIRLVANDTKKALVATAAFAMAVVYIQDASWFFLWDAIDLSTMIVFAYAVFYARSDLRILAPLFIVELLNRESADFIALWIILDSAWTLYRSKCADDTREQAVAQGVVGMALLAGGTLWTHWIRKTMFRHSFDSKINLDLKHSGDGQWMTLFVNLRMTTVMEEMSAYAIALICCLALAMLLYRLIKIQGVDALPAAALISSMVLSVWLFGRVVETRVWLDFVPFGIFYAFTVEKYGSISVRATEPARIMKRAA